MFCVQNVNVPEEGKKAVVSGGMKKEGGDVVISSHSKTISPHSKKLICVGIFASLGIILLIVMFFPKNKDIYVPGVYNASIDLGDNAVDIEVTVDAKTIKSIRMFNCDETVSTMYPLIKPAFEDLVSQICESQSLEGITYSEESKHTSMVLLNAIKEALQKAEKASGSTGEN